MDNGVHLDYLHASLELAVNTTVALHQSPQGVPVRHLLNQAASAGTATTAKDSMDIVFDKFWVDVGADSLRRKLYDPEVEAEAGAEPMNSNDQRVSAVGRLAFFPQFATFPVYYVDEDMTGVPAMLLFCTDLSPSSFAPSPSAPQPRCSGFLLSLLQ